MKKEERKNTVHHGFVFKGVSTICGKDSLRPKYNGAVIKNGKIECTDAHQLIRIDLSFFGIDKQTIELLENKYIPHYVLTELGKIKQKEDWFFDGEKFNVMTENECSIIRSYPIKENIHDWFDFDKVIPNSEKPKPITEIAFSGLYLKNIQNIYNCVHGIGFGYSLKTSFDGKKAITIRNEENTFLGLIMPIMISF